MRRPPCLATLAILATLVAGPVVAETPDTGLESLDALAIPTLRARSYDSTIGGTETIACPSIAEGAESEILTYTSEGLRQYARLSRPDGDGGEAPVVLFLHGWVGAENAPAYNFSCEEGGYYAEFVNGWLERGYAVLMPGFRGHGTFGGGPAEGIEWLTAWDNGSYLSPAFYAIDALNLLSAVPDIDGLDADRVHVVGHSQGGDVAAMVLAAVGEGAGNGLSVASGGLWAATFPDRVTQVETFRPMESTTEAFLAGDGTWTGTAVGADGSVNPVFVFGYPPSWIGTMNRDEWTWQADFWSRSPGVRDAIALKLDEMYGALAAGVPGFEEAEWTIETGADGALTVVHDADVADAMGRIGAFRFPEFLSEPVNLHFSDRDFYSLPAWNNDLCERVNAGGGACTAHEYPGTTHTLGVADAAWYSPAGTEPGLATMIGRDAALGGS